MARPLTTPAELTGELSPDAALRRIVAACRSDLNKYRAVVLAGSRPIGVHQSRVALRRLRAAIGLFRDAFDESDPNGSDLRSLSAEARWLAAELAPARDLHVFLKETAPDAPQPVQRIGRRLARQRLERARQALSGARFGEFDARLEKFAAAAPLAIGTPLTKFGDAALGLRHAKVGRRGERIDHLGAKPLHKLRIAVKKLRYAAIFLRPLFSGPGFDSKAAKPYIEATARLQGALGALNDRAVAAQIIADIAQAARPSELAKKPLERVARQVKAGTKRDKHRIGRAWKTFRKAEPFWRM